MSAKCWQGRTLPLSSNGWFSLEKLQLEPLLATGMLTPSHLSLWFEQEDRKATAPRSPVVSIPWEEATGPDQPQARDSISGGLAGTRDKTFI